jgi:ferritin-like protein
MSADLPGLFTGLDQSSLDRLATRRDALRSGGRAAAAFAMATAPFALAAAAGRAAASTAARTVGRAGALPAKVVDVLNFALTLEYLEATFYNRGLRQGVVPAGKDRRIFETIQDHENAHVAFLKQALGSQAIAKPEFDFTAGGAIPNPFKNYEIFKIVAQGFEDTGVRAYKGQAGALKPYDAYLTAALTIHSVEARHASEVRRLRGESGWIPTDDPKAPVPIKATYRGEDETNQLGIDVGAYLGRMNGTESFDEPLTKAQVIDIVRPFLA